MNVMKRITQRSGSTPQGLPRALGAAEVARVKGGSTMIEYGLMLAPTAVEYAVMLAPTGVASGNG